MSLHNYIFIAIFLLFTFSVSTRRTAIVLLVAYLVYYNFALSYDGLARYAITAFIDFIVCLVLLDYIYKVDLSRFKNNSVGFFAMMAVWVNSVGWIMYENYFPPTLYNNLCIAVMVLQVLSLLYKVISNGGIARDSSRYTVFRTSNNDNHKGFLQLQAEKDKGQ